jgi:hypothetical protein
MKSLLHVHDCLFIADVYLHCNPIFLLIIYALRVLRCEFAELIFKPFGQFALKNHLFS